MRQLKIASWNVRTLSDASTSKRQAPERRSALVAAELERLNIDVACLSECRIPEEGEFTDGSYTFFHSGRSSDQPRQDRLLLLGDFNARVGCDCETWPEVIGQYGLGKENNQGITLLELCTRFGLTIANTLFSHPDIHRGTWKHPRSQRWHMIDYVIIRQHYRSDLVDARVCRSADCWTDHRLVCARLKLRFHISSQRKLNSGPRRLNINRLKVPEVNSQLREKIAANVQDLDAEPLDDHWKSLKETLYNTTKETVGFQKRQHRDWFRTHLKIVSITELPGITAKESSAAYKTNGGWIELVRSKPMQNGMTPRASSRQ
ncbi:uncharacterized protein LOC114576052 [Exaiptasia diaphana]|uniref:Endonuclease/exonuclease/phosphatase domain-containing protein n=1 Tax=Exaiptasia diaphana TaxID=2652724 RepID=A0A913YUX3_EXADI|nr:uncharacterized protein LOC114576052 [Exaiptasia diaphana]